MECFASWCRRTLGTQGPYHLHKVDISYNNLSNGALEILMKTFREMQVRVDLLNLSGNWFSNLDPLVEYIWESEPIKAIGLKNNKLSRKEVVSLLRIVYNQGAYPGKSRDGKHFLPLRLELAGNPEVGNYLNGLLGEVYGHAPEKVYFSTDDVCKEELSCDNLLFLAAHVPGCGVKWKPPTKKSNHSPRKARSLSGRNSSESRDKRKRRDRDRDRDRRKKKRRERSDSDRPSESREEERRVKKRKADKERKRKADKDVSRERSRHRKRDDSREKKSKKKV